MTTISELLHRLENDEVFIAKLMARVTILERILKVSKRQGEKDGY